MSAKARIEADQFEFRFVVDFLPSDPLPCEPFETGFRAALPFLLASAVRVEACLDGLLQPWPLPLPVSVGNLHGPFGCFSSDELGATI